jgi:hypothetical protein
LVAWALKRLEDRDYVIGHQPLAASLASQKMHAGGPSASRRNGAPADRNDQVGFRVVCAP